MYNMFNTPLIRKQKQLFPNGMNCNKNSKYDYDKMLELYNNYKVKDIAKMFNVSDVAIHRALKRLGIK